MDNWFSLQHSSPGSVALFQMNSGEGGIPEPQVTPASSPKSQVSFGSSRIHHSFTLKKVFVQQRDQSSVFTSISVSVLLRCLINTTNLTGYFVASFYFYFSLWWIDFPLSICLSTSPIEEHSLKVSIADLSFVSTPRLWLCSFVWFKT